MLRIIAGKLKGKRLLQPQTNLTRPTIDRVKESIFNILTSILAQNNQQWEDQIAIDFFAGSGSLIFEAISRGATHGTLIDCHPTALHTLKINQQSLGLQKQTTVMNLNVEYLPPAPQAYSLIFLDPPYNFLSLDSLFAKIIALGWVQAQGILVLELAKTAPVPAHLNFNIITERSYGRIKIVIGQYFT